MSCIRTRGFTLIEVLVALVIVAVGMSALLSALSSSAKSVSYMQDKTFAEWVALNQITSVRTQIKAPGQIPSTGKTSGDVDLGNRSWHWSQEVVASEVPGIVRIDVKVRPKDVGSASDDDNANWYVTVSGLAGNAMAAPGTYQWPWINVGALPPGQNGINGNNSGTTLNNPGGTNPNPGGTNPNRGSTSTPNPSNNPTNNPLRQ